jgi:ribosomal protein L37AE/L43A
MSAVKGREKYTWDDEWYKLINQLICPYCENNLIKKGISKSCKCGLYVLGDAKSVSFKLIKTLPKIIPLTDCTHANVQYDSKHDEDVCIKCGEVTSGPPAYCGYLPIKYSRGHRFDTGEIDKYN